MELKIELLNPVDTFFSCLLYQIRGKSDEQKTSNPLCYLLRGRPFLYSLPLLILRQTLSDGIVETSMTDQPFPHAHGTIVMTVEQNNIFTFDIAPKRSNSTFNIAAVIQESGTTWETFTTLEFRSPFISTSLNRFLK